MRHSLLLAAACLAAGTGLAQAAPPALTIYAAQHPQVEAMLADAFTKETGIPVKLHQGEGPEIAAQILEEGSASPADIFFTENSPELNLLDEKGLLAPVDPKTLAQVPANYNAADGNWLGVLARENVLAYNPAKISESALPASLLDLAQPQWQGKIGIAPSDGDFLPLVSAVIKEKGNAAALAWLKGLKDNAKIYEDDEGVAAAVAHGDVAAGVINNYYWYRLETELGPPGHSQQDLSFLQWRSRRAGECLGRGDFEILPAPEGGTGIPGLPGGPRGAGDAGQERCRFRISAAPWHCAQPRAEALQGLAAARDQGLRSGG